MVDISSQNNKINVTVSSSGNTANTNVTPDYAQYYSEKSKEWAISNRIVDNTDYSSKYYANESKKQADISTTKATEVIESGNNAVSNIESARDNAILDVNTAGATQVALATEQATIATNKASEVVASGNEALSNIDTAKNNAITSITNQETTSKTSLIDEGATQIGLIQNEGATQVANVQSTGFYMRDDKLYFINSQGEETEFKSGGSGLEICDIGMALYVDETKGLRRYLNGQIVDINTNTQAFLNRLLQIQTTNPDYFTTEENWQAEALLNVDGCVYKFVLNYSGADVVSVRLPKYPDYVEINAGGTLPVFGTGKTLGLTDGTHNVGIYSFSGLSGSPLNASTNGFNVAPSTSVPGTSGRVANGLYGVTTDPTKSGIETTLKQTKIKMRYFIQIATGSETENNIINEIKLNNPYSLFDSKYSDHELNNLSWLKSEGQWNAKAVYPTAYDKLLKVYNGTETVEGLSVKLPTETYTDYDFVLNTADETFRLPLKNGNEHIPDYSNGTVITSTNAFIVPSNGVVAGTIDAGLRTNKSIIINGRKIESVWGGDTAQDGCPFYVEVKKGDSVVIEKITINEGWAKPTFYPFVSNGSLYFYVGETVQNANLIDAGRIGEQLANKQDKCIHIIETYVNGTSGYRIWSDGYCEQWGKVRLNGAISSTNLTITFLKKFANSNYFSIASADANNGSSIVLVGWQNATSMTIGSESGKGIVCWKACGYLAEGEY